MKSHEKVFMRALQEREACWWEEGGVAGFPLCCFLFSCVATPVGWHGRYVCTCLILRSCMSFCGVLSVSSVKGRFAFWTLSLCKFDVLLFLMKINVGGGCVWHCFSSFASSLLVRRGVRSWRDVWSWRDVRQESAECELVRLQCLKIRILRILRSFEDFKKLSGLSHSGSATESDLEQCCWFDTNLFLS